MTKQGKYHKYHRVDGVLYGLSPNQSCSGCAASSQAGLSVGDAAELCRAFGNACMKVRESSWVKLS